MKENARIAVIMVHFLKRYQGQKERQKNTRKNILFPVVYKDKSLKTMNEPYC